jgi:ATP-dependent RNA helicase DeaD
MDLSHLAPSGADSSVLDEAAPTPRFDAVPARLRPALEARGFDALTDVQRAVLEAEVEGRDLQISSQTGSGKTVALGFVLAPPLENEPAGDGPEALIIVPTRELAAQVCAELRWLVADLPGVRVASVTGGTPVFRERQILARRPRILVGTPGRLLDHVRSGALALGSVRELVLDEADQMLDMGFREELEGILEATPSTRRTHLVSATFPDGIQQLAARYQRDPVAIEGTRLGDANEDIEHTGHLVHQRDRYAALVNLLLQADGERTLVFVERRADALEVAERLEADGFAALPLSGELAQSQRERTLAAFRAGRATVLVATDVAARGLDVPDVATVIHTAPPIDAQVYTHRSGRTGRAGKRGHSVLLSPPNRRRRVISLLAEAGVELRWAPVPDAAEVRAQLAARAREKLVAELDGALARQPSTAQLAHAEELLDGRDAAALVAALLSRLEPAARVQPRDVETPRVSDEPRRPECSRPVGPNRFGRDGAVRFFMNWGVNQGANPSRLLAAVCRRGQVQGTDIGSIAIHPNASTFDVNGAVAERFERLAGRRDARDPKTHIRRDRGPQSGPRRRKS